MNLPIQIAFLTLFQAAPAVQPARATIEGTVLESGKGNPVADAGVELRLEGTGPGKPLTAVTSATGKFAFKDIPPGKYRLAATHPGFLRTEYGQRGINGHGVSFVLAPDQSMKDAQIALIETGTISGRILASDGEPVANVQIQALKYAYYNGRRALKTVKGAVTNDLGEYRLYWLPPESYVVMATPLRVALPDTLIQVLSEDHTLTSEIRSPSGEFIFPPDDEPSRAYYFPGTPDAEFARTIAVRPGEETGSMDMILKPPAAHRIRGKVTNLPALDAAGNPEAATFVRLQSRNAGVLFESVELSALHVADKQTGSFDIRGVLPGAYYLDATGDGISSGRIPIDVADNDVRDIAIGLAPWFNVTVRASLDRLGNDSMTSSLNQLLMDLSLSGVRGLISGPVPYKPTGAGTYVLRDVAPLDYRLFVRNLPESAYLKSIRLDGIEVLDREFHLERSPANPIEVLIGLNAGRVSGVVYTGRQTPIENVTVALVPDERRQQRWDLYQTAISGAQGDFEFAGIAPGDYRLFSWEDVPENAWQDPAFISKFENRAKRIHIEEGSHESLDLTAISIDSQ